MAALLWSCAEEEYTTSSSATLEIADSLKLDTVFSNIPTVTKDFWIYNRNKKGIRLTSVRQARGNQSGFRVNIDGIYLGPSNGYQTSEVEVRSGDSIRVFVELTTTTTGKTEPLEVNDELLFTLQSGSVQKVNLNAFSWDANIMENPVIAEDITLTGDKPIVVLGTMTVNPGVTLTLQAGTTLYFRDEAKIDVHGRFLSKGEAGNEVVMRGYRLDNILKDLPYDRISGQWRGIKFYEESYGNEIHYTDIHSTFTGIEIDSSDVDKQTLLMSSSTVHNCQGYGIICHSSWILLDNCQLSNTLNDCLAVDGGIAVLNNCTLAQFYPFDAKRGAALFFSSAKHDVNVTCLNSIITGYANDVWTAVKSDDHVLEYKFLNTIIRTPQVGEEDLPKFENVVFENVEDTTTGKKHFVNIDTDNFIYDFRLTATSTAIDAANPLTALPTDRVGLMRDEKPDVGAFERPKQ